MTYALDTNIYQVWRNFNDPAIQRIRNHPTIQTIEQCFGDIEAGETLVIPRIILTEHLIWIAKTEGIDTAFDVLDIIHNSPWKVAYEDEELHRLAIEIGSKYGGMGAADLLLSATAKQENATIITMDAGFKKLNPEIDVIVLGSIADLI
ncbi:MAG TPA: type II toxin-antitoxin system VapC family toxin [Methanosarcinaceae archaeon]|nr:type II toxin-antitoxin system VapC family toxin [Methanosarcinaceae archaeon]